MSKKTSTNTSEAPKAKAADPINAVHALVQAMVATEQATVPAIQALRNFADTVTAATWPEYIRGKDSAFSNTCRGAKMAEATITTRRSEVSKMLRAHFAEQGRKIDPSKGWHSNVSESGEALSGSKGPKAALDDNGWIKKATADALRIAESKPMIYVKELGDRLLKIANAPTKPLDPNKAPGLVSTTTPPSVEAPKVPAVETE